MGTGTNITKDSAGRPTARFGGITWKIPTMWSGTPYGSNKESKWNPNWDNSPVYKQYLPTVWGTAMVYPPVINVVGEANSTRGEAVLSLGPLLDIYTVNVNDHDLPDATPYLTRPTELHGLPGSLPSSIDPLHRFNRITSGDRSGALLTDAGFNDPFAADSIAGDYSTKITAGTYSIGISGNSATVTNGLYSNGSYSDPAWQTISKSKVGLSAVENTALSSWAGTANVTTLGTIGSGIWHGTAIGDTYIASAADWNAKQAALGFTAENIANKGAVSGYATIDATGKVPAAQLPSSSGTTALVSDNAPQLGGNLDMNTHNIQTVTPVEMAFVHGLTSAVQTQLDAKQAVITSAPGARPSTFAPSAHTHGAADLIAGDYSKITAGTYSIAISGNAGTVTNGLHSNGSYSDPSWLIISKTKVGLSAVENTASPPGLVRLM